MKSSLGFTLTEVLIAVVLVGLLAAIAVPSYQSFITKSNLSEGTDALASAQIKMESFFQNAGTYTGAPTCTTPATLKNFTLTCTTTGTAYLYTASGSSRSVQGTSYSVDDQGNHRTNGAGSCWIGVEC